MFLVNEFVEMSNCEEIVFIIVVSIVVIKNLLINGWNKILENKIKMVLGLLMVKLNWLV